MIKEQYIGTKVFIKRLNLTLEVKPENEKELIHFGFTHFIEPKITKKKENDSTTEILRKSDNSNANRKRKPKQS